MHHWPSPRGEARPDFLVSYHGRRLEISRRLAVARLNKHSAQYSRPAENSQRSPRSEARLQGRRIITLGAARAWKAHPVCVRVARPNYAEANFSARYSSMFSRFHEAMFTSSMVVPDASCMNRFGGAPWVYVTLRLLNLGAASRTNSWIAG